LSFDDFSLECFTLRSDVDVIANFSSSDPWLNELRQFVRNTFDANMMSVQSDCPHRERFGYGGDALGSGEAGTLISLYYFVSNLVQFSSVSHRYRQHIASLKYL
jgi:hypothetical protein